MSARETLKKYEIEINKHDFALLLPLLSPACKFWFTSGTYVGHEQCREAFKTSCFRREAEGWKIIQEHLSNFPK